MIILIYTDSYNNKYIAEESTPEDCISYISKWTEDEYIVPDNCRWYDAKEIELTLKTEYIIE